MRKRLSRATRERIYAMYGGRCAYCGKKITYKEMQVDHVQALHIGGANEAKNYRPACRMCNHYKSTMDVETFRYQLGLLPKRLEHNVYIYKLALRHGLITENPGPVTFLFEREAPQEAQNGDVGGDNA